MDPEQINLLLARIELLENKMDQFNFPERYQFSQDTRLSGQRFGAFNAFPVVQPISHGTTLNMTVVGGTTVTESNGFSANFGSSFYTIGDIVLALKQLGWIKK